MGWRTGLRRAAPWLVALVCTPALAHKPSDSYLTLSVAGRDIEVRWDIALRDLDNELALDTDDDGKLSWGEVKARAADINALAFSNLTLKSDGVACQTEAAPTGGLMLDTHSDGTYAVLREVVRCPGTVARLDVDYHLFAATDPSHRGIVRVTSAGVERSAVMGPSDAHRQFDVGHVSPLEVLADFVREGIWHIWLGFDHILFLLALLLPSVLGTPTQDGRRGPAPGFRKALVDVVRIVTAFTVAHSITLTLAVLGVVSLPSRLVESAIAATVILAAANNVYPILKEKRWVAAFCFGLIHGFGFASALRDLGLPTGALALSLFGFNLGVEIGQLTIVSIFFPVAFLMRTTQLYRRWILVTGSTAIFALASIWLAERVFDFKVLPV